MDVSIIPLFIGTYTRTGKSKGIYIYDFHTDTGKAVINNVIEAENPSFLAISPDRKFMYAVNERSPLGTVCAYRYYEQDRKIELLSKKPTEGVSPCHIAIDSRSRHAIVSNYTSGNLNVFSISPDGHLGELVQKIEYEGNGPNLRRQEKPHIHSAFFSKDEHFVFIQDLGTDRIYIYRYFPESDNFPLQPMPIPFIECTAGSGPRHITLSRDGKYVYLVHELIAQVTVYTHNEGKLSAIQEVGINEECFKGTDGAGEIKLSPDGNFLYASNRGEANILAIYAVNPKNGTLTKIGNQSVLGFGPRHFTISPDGKFLLIGNQASDEVVIFKRDKNTGLLCDSGQRISIGTPACLVF